MLNVTMLSVTYKPFLLSAVMLNVVMLSVVAPTAGFFIVNVYNEVIKLKKNRIFIFEMAALVVTLVLKWRRDTRPNDNLPHDSIATPTILISTISKTFLL